MAEEPWERPLPIGAQQLLNQLENAYRETLAIILAALGLDGEWSYDSARGVLVRKREPRVPRVDEDGPDKDP